MTSPVFAIHDTVRQSCEDCQVSHCPACDVWVDWEELSEEEAHADGCAFPIALKWAWVLEDQIEERPWLTP